MDKHIYRLVAACSILLLLILVFNSVDAATKNGFVLDDALVAEKNIRRGGPPRDGIPSLDYPDIIASHEADYLRATDRVLGVIINGVARAYPIRILNYHEIVNDVVAGEGIVVTYCPLCGSGVVFDAEQNGVIVEFGVSGLLYNSDVLLYDRRTGSLWSQIMRTAISGAMKGEILVALPASHTTWNDWRGRYPDTEVLSRDTGFGHNYRVNPYAGYSGTGQIYFPVTGEDKRYRRKEPVLGLEINGRFRAYPLIELEKSPASFRDEFEGVKIIVNFDAENESAWITRESGEQIPTMLAYWFAWYAFHPDTGVFTANQASGQLQRSQPSR